ncbi:MAG: hypothetical protein NC923_02225, partial [Candidatus Omnitrophica bacterium]|nr:hypothetical protein [Candidatus Omnitrophota bacterium]
ECRQFPGGKHPDGLDALEMAIRIAVENRSTMVNKDFMNLLKRQKLLNLYPVQLSIEEQLKRVMRGDWGDALGGCLAKI